MMLKSASWFKLFSLIGLLILTVISSLLPLRLTTSSSSAAWILAYTTFFNSGVFLGTGLFHMLPDALEQLEISGFSTSFPIVFFTSAIGFVFIWALGKIKFGADFDANLPSADLLTFATSAHQQNGACICYVSVDPVTTYGAFATHKDKESSLTMKAKATATAEVFFNDATNVDARGAATNAATAAATAMASAAAEITSQEVANGSYSGETNNPEQDGVTHLLLKPKLRDHSASLDRNRSPILRSQSLPVSENDPSHRHQPNIHSQNDGCSSVYCKTRTKGTPQHNSHSSERSTRIILPRSNDISDSGRSQHASKANDEIEGMESESLLVPIVRVVHFNDEDSGKHVHEGEENRLHNHEETDQDETERLLHDHNHDNFHHHHIVMTGSAYLPILIAVVFSIHSFIEGLALGIQPALSASGVSLLFAITSHKAVEALSVGSNFAKEEVVLSRAVPVLLVYCCMTPLGILLGWLAADTLETTALVPLIQAELQAFASGSFIYLAVHEINDVDCCESVPPIWQVLLLLAGLVVMALFAIFI